MSNKYSSIRLACLARLLAAFCLLGLASASAQVFAVSGSLGDGSSLSGTFIVSGGAVATPNIAIGAPDSVTCAGAFTANAPNPPNGYLFRVLCTSGKVLTLDLSTPADPTGGTLTNYAGGPLRSISHLIDPGPPATDHPLASGTVVEIAPFQVRYVANLDAGDSVINLSNDGASSNGSTFAPGGNLCVGVYAFDPSEELLSCCTCLVTPDGLVSTSASAINSKNLTPEIPTSLVIKLLAWSTTGESSSGCNAGIPGTLADGLQAWATTLHALPTTPAAYGVTETPFSQATLSPTELSHIAQFCQFNQTNGSGFGVCPGCNAGGLGAAASQ